MAPLTRGNHKLAKKIATLRLPLAPLVPLPFGPPHPAFPRTLMAYHLLTEDELDSMVSYYHQSTPGPWTQLYPALMNWDKEFLARPPPASPHHGADSLLQGGTDAGRSSLVEHEPRIELPTTASTLRHPVEVAYGLNGEVDEVKFNPVVLSDSDRIRIKRRKFGKFIGLVGLETPVEEIMGRVHSNAVLAVWRARQESRRKEREVLGRKWV